MDNAKTEPQMRTDDDLVVTSAESTASSPDLSNSNLRRTLQKAESLAAAGRWRRLIIMVGADEANMNCSELVVQRVRAAVELDDSDELARCVEPAQRLANVAHRVNLASLMVNANQPTMAAAILRSVPADVTSEKAIKVARRIRAATSDAFARHQVSHLIVKSDRDTGRETVDHRFPGDTEVYDVAPANLRVIRLDGVAPAIEARVQEIWTGFADRLAARPYPFVREYRDVFVNQTGQIWSADGATIKGNNLPVPDIRDPASVPVFDQAISCVRQNKGYYEWLVERLAILSWRLAPETPDCTILLRKEQLGLALDALGALGVPAEQMVAVEAPVFCRQLFVGSSSSATLARKAAYQHTYGKLIAAAEHSGAQSTPQRFYISRRDSPRRAMTNEPAFEQAMADRGFTPVVLSELGLLDKINLFRNAEIVVGAHGAGFSHLLFAKPGLRVIEIMPVTMNQFAHMGARVCFSLLSKVFGLHHTMVLHPMNPLSSEWSSDPKLIDELLAAG